MSEATAMSGPRLFARFAVPPNQLGYCGPSDGGAMAEALADGSNGEATLARLGVEFDGAWPYLELLAGAAGLAPLDPGVVEAYWIGSPLLWKVDTLDWGNSIQDRFRSRAGLDATYLDNALDGGGVPHHSFHVYCVYPWVGLLRSGAGNPALNVLDRCRIRWGRVDEIEGGTAIVASRPLEWDGRRLTLGPVRSEIVSMPADPGGPEVRPGDMAALHWNALCWPLRPEQLTHLVRVDEHHRGLINGSAWRLEARLEV